MRISRSVRRALVVEVLGAALALAQGTYKVESAGAPTNLSPALQDALQSSGARLVNDQGAAVAEVWLRKSIPVQESSAKSVDILYPALGTGTMVGVARFPNGSSDFRGQPIKPGVYTLRYAQIPQDGNHLGVSPYRDFLLLGPAAADTDIDKPLSFDAVVKLSRGASGTGHPAILSLDPATEGKSEPAAFQDDQGHWALQVKVKASAGAQDFSIGIVLVGKTEAG